MVFSIFPWFDISEAQEIGFALTVSGADRVVAFLTLVVVAPIAEEIIFRGWLYGRLRDNTFKKLSTAWRIGWSVFLTSLLFGILHQQWNVGVNVFAMSVVLCGLREFTGTIYAGILLHMLKNGLAFYSLFVAGLG
jgi:membrane protease YdiL (CAAX protease family)